jgi:hypothetical protein
MDVKAPAAPTEINETLERFRLALRESIDEALRESIGEALGEAGYRLEESEEGLRAVRVETFVEQPGMTVAELATQSHLSEDALVAFAQTAGELLGANPRRELSVEAARRGGLLAVASQAWENELGPLLGTAEVRELLSISRQRVDELWRSRRLIALLDSAGRRQYPLFQFHDGRPLQPLIAAFWTVADVALSPWTAASWSVAADNDALEGMSPAEWAKAGRDPTLLERVARQDASRLDR